MSTESQRIAIVAWARENGLDPAVERLIRLANNDLYIGPMEVSEEWPGFTAACEKIRAALPSGELWVDKQLDCVCDSEPSWWYPGCDEDELLEYPEDWIRYESREVKRAIVGRELLPYVL